jgi:riboflavin kinase/FMN adenylyltransferase
VELVRGLHNIQDRHKGCVLTIGKFDGVHLGHQAVLSRLVEKAKELKLPSVVMVFEPQPEEVFTPEHAPARLSRLRDKYKAFASLGIDRLLVINFNPKLSSMSANAFIEDLLVKKLGVQFLVVGDDFRFGHKRQGNFELLQRESSRFRFDVVSTQSFKLLECRISSTEIRTALEQNNFALAERMLGTPFVISGRVVHGDKKGRTIGFPTANVLLKRCRSPVQGVYAVKVKVKGECYKGVANVGTRPTVKGERSQLEVHIFDFKQTIYGELVDVSFVSKIREERRFDSFEALRSQITIDAQAARAQFAIA